jgi:hypothetical protein
MVEDSWRGFSGEGRSAPIYGCIIVGSDQAAPPSRLEANAGQLNAQLRQSAVETDERGAN